MLQAVEETADFTRRRILGIRQLMSETADLIRNRLPKIYTKELVELLFAQPYVKAEYLVKAGLVKRQTAAEYLKELEQIGVLQSIKVGRENIFLNLSLYELLST